MGSSPAPARLNVELLTARNIQSPAAGVQWNASPSDPPFSRRKRANTPAGDRSAWVDIEALDKILNAPHLGANMKEIIMNGIENRFSRVNAMNVFLGLWVLISPFVLGFSQNAAAVRNNVLAGILVVLFSLAAAARQSGGFNVLLGIWLIISPFVLTFGNRPALFWNNIVLGCLIVLFAALNMPANRRVVAENRPPS